MTFDLVERQLAQKIFRRIDNWSTVGRPYAGSNVYFRQIVTELGRMLVEINVFAPRPNTCTRMLCSSHVYDVLSCFLYTALYIVVFFMCILCIKSVQYVKSYKKYLSNQNN